MKAKSNSVNITLSDDKNLKLVQDNHYLHYFISDNLNGEFTLSRSMGYEMGHEMDRSIVHSYKNEFYAINELQQFRDYVGEQVSSKLNTDTLTLESIMHEHENYRIKELKLGNVGEINFSEYNSMTSDEKKDFQQATFQNLVSRVDSMSSSSSNYKEALIDYGRFDNYSLYNRMILSDQLKIRGNSNDAPVFKTYNDWKRDGIFVKKGAKAYALIVPNSVDKYNEDGVWKDVTNENKDFVMKNEFEIKRFTFFNLKSTAFHISDTNSPLNILDPGQNNHFTVDLDKETEFEQIYKAVKDSFAEKYKISENKNFDSDFGGRAIKNLDTGEKSIVINANYTSSMKLNILFHEVAHLELGHLDDRQLVDHDIKELEAESTAFLFASKFGVSMDISEQYLKSYSRNNDMSKLFSKIFDTSNSIEKQFSKSIIDNVNERDYNQNQVADINEEELFSNITHVELT